MFSIAGGGIRLFGPFCRGVLSRSRAARDLLKSSATPAPRRPEISLRRLKARGCAGIVTGGELRDTDGIANTGLVAYHRRPCHPVCLSSGICHLGVQRSAALSTSLP
jgi:hypothetical protein